MVFGPDTSFVLYFSSLHFYKDTWHGMLKCDMFLASIALEIILFTNGYKKILFYTL